MQAELLGTSYAAVLGQMIKKLREQHSLDQKAVADKIGVSVMSVSRIENGEAVLDVPQMEKAARAFGMDPVEFFKKSLAIKRELEKRHYVVLGDKKEINESSNLAILSLALIAGIIAMILFSKK